MSIHVDLLIPSFSTPFGQGAFAGGLEEPFKESELQNLQDQCASAFGVDERSIQIFKMVNNKMDVRVGCYINSTDLNMDVISHTMKQNKVLQDLLAKSTEAVLQFQQQRDNDLRQLLATTHELTELKLAHQELKSKIKLMKMKKQLAENDNQQQQLFKPDLSRSQNPDTTRSRFMDRLANTPLQSSPPHSLAASAPSIPPPATSSLLSSPSSPSLSLSDESIPPGPSGMAPLDISDSPPSPINSDMVSEHLRKKLIALAKDGPYYSYSSGVSSSPPSRPLTASKPSPPAGPRPGSHASPRLGSRVLSRATLQWDLAEAAANGKDDRTSPPISSTPPSITSTLSILPRASTPKNIRVNTPRSHQSPRRTFIDPFHLSTPAGVVQLPTASSSSPSPHDTLVVRGKNV